MIIMPIVTPMVVGHAGGQIPWSDPILCSLSASGIFWLL